MLQCVQLVRVCNFAVILARHVLVALSKKSTCAAAWIVNRFSHNWIDCPDHNPDDLAGCEELAAVVSLLAHFEQQALVNLGEREDMRLVNRVQMNLMHHVQHVQQISLRVDASIFYVREYLADHFLPWRGIGHVSQALQARDQVAIYKALEGAERPAKLKLSALFALR